MSEITYFGRPGRGNTEKTALLAGRRARELGINTVVVASNTGETALTAIPLLGECAVVVVTHSTGFLEPNVQEMPAENRLRLESMGAKVLTCQHAFGGVNRAIRRKLKTYQVDEIIAYTLRLFGEGTKVACEVVLMAADAGLVRTDEEVIAIGGTGRGADTALVVQPAHAQDFFDLKVKEIICKPRL